MSAIRARPLTSAISCGSARPAAPPVGVFDVRDGQGDDLDAVAVLGLLARHLAVRAQRAREHEADRALLEHTGHAVARARLEPRIGDLAEGEGALEVVARLGGVTDPELDVVDPVERHEVAFRMFAVRRTLKGA
jgi:hypothetical protein